MSSQRDLEDRVGFFRSGARPPHEVMIAYIDMYRDQFGVGVICHTLAGTERGFITSRGYRAAKTRPMCDRALRDRELITEIRRVHAENYDVYGVGKIWHAMRRQGWVTGRDQCARLMRKAGIHGVIRGHKPRTTVSSPRPDARPDLIERQFRAAGPDRLRVADMTYARTTSGFCYTAFVIDVFSRRITGWATRASMRTEDLPLEALEHALIAAKDQALDALVHHSDQGSQYVSIRYTEHLAQAGIVASVGSKGNSYDNALAESVNGLHKTELIHDKPAWPSVTEVEFTTMNQVYQWNNHRLNQSLNYRTPAEVERAYTENREPSWTPT